MKKKRLTIMYLKIRVLELFCLREHLSEVTLHRLFKNLNSLNQIIRVNIKIYQ